MVATKKRERGRERGRREREGEREGRREREEEERERKIKSAHLFTLCAPIEKKLEKNETGTPLPFSPARGLFPSSSPPPHRLTVAPLHKGLDPRHALQSARAALGGGAPRDRQDDDGVRRAEPLRRRRGCRGLFARAQARVWHVGVVPAVWVQGEETREGDRERNE